MVMEKIKNYIKWAGWPLLVLVLWFNGCGNDGSDTDVVTIPERKGSFAPVLNPEPLPAPEKEYVYRYINKVTHDTVKVKVQNPVNIELLEKFEQLGANKDSLYLDAIGQRNYEIVQEDSLLRTVNKIKTQGTVLSFQQDYTIKPQKVAVPSKEVTFRMLAGLEVGNTAAFDNFNAKANVMFQNKRGDIFNAGYDTEQRWWAGYARSIFAVKK